MSDPRRLTERELLDLFDRCEAHPGIRQAIREVLDPNARAHTLDLDSPEAVERLARELARRDDAEPTDPIALYDMVSAAAIIAALREGTA